MNKSSILLSNIMEGLYEGVYNSRNVILTGIAFNSNNVNEGDVFVCTPGYTKDSGETRTDTHEFANEAIKKGAVAIVAERNILLDRKVPIYIVKDSWKVLSKLSSRFYNKPSNKLKVIGVTGTNGKTSITYIIESILKFNGDKAGIIGTINNRFDSKIESTNNTTPEAPIIHSIFQQALENSFDYMVLEVTSHALELKRVADVNFDVAIFTNLTQDHLNFHGTLENYYLAKERLFKLLNKKGIAVLNKDDKYYERLAEASNGHVVTYGIECDADYKAENIQCSSQGSMFNLVYKEDRYKIFTPLIGKHYVYNCLASIAACHSYGIPLANAIKGASEIHIPGRIEKINGCQPFDIYIDFAHTPDAMNETLKGLKNICKGRLITVFGCGGDRDKAKRPIMGAISETFSDISIITSDNSRNEGIKNIINDIKAGMKNSCEVIVDRKEAIQKSIKIAKPGDLVVILGRGHEEFQREKGMKIALNDKLIVEEYLANL